MKVTYDTLESTPGRNGEEDKFPEAHSCVCMMVLIS